EISALERKSDVCFGPIEKFAKLGEALTGNNNAALEIGSGEENLLIHERKTMTVGRGHAHHIAFELLEENSIEMVPGRIRRYREGGTVDHVRESRDAGVGIGLLFEGGKRGVLIRRETYDVEL